MATGPAGGGEVVIGDALSTFFVIVISCCDTLLPLAAATVGTKHSAINPKPNHLIMKVSLRYCKGLGHWWDYRSDNDVAFVSRPTVRPMRAERTNRSSFAVW
jgi:hypothetical protein